MIDSRIAIGMESIQRALEDLPDLAREWGDLGEGERASWSLDWDHLMGTYLRLLDRHDRAGTMPRDQHARYRTLLRRLREVQPLIERLGLYPPPVSLEV